jgi:beta-hydroxylase
VTGSTYPPADKRLGGVRDLRRRMAIRLGIALMGVIDKILIRYSPLGDPARFDTSEFPWAAELERNWPLIRQEADDVLRDAKNVPPLRRISRDHDKIAIDDKWRSFFLWGYGIRVDTNCVRCPQTTALVERIPGLQTALFSILAPGTRIPLHNGATKAILTGHLGLRVPRQRQRCYITVDGDGYAWREGELFVFDDMRMHEVLNDTEEYRVVLMMHVTRPLRFPGSVLANGIIAVIRKSPFVKDAHSGLERWAGRSLSDPEDVSLFDELRRDQ